MSTKWDEWVLAQLLASLNGREMERPQGNWPDTVVSLGFPGDRRSARYFELPDPLTVNTFCTNYVIRTGVSVIQFGPQDGSAGFMEGGHPVV